MTKDQILAEAKALEPREREALADELLLTLVEDPAIEAAWQRECVDRIAAVDRGELPVKPGEQVMTEIRHRLQQ